MGALFSLGSESPMLMTSNQPQTVLDLPEESNHPNFFRFLRLDRIELCSVADTWEDPNIPLDEDSNLMFVHVLVIRNEEELLGQFLERHAGVINLNTSFPNFLRLFHEVDGECTIGVLHLAAHLDLPFLMTQLLRSSDRMALDTTISPLFFSAMNHNKKQECTKQLLSLGLSPHATVDLDETGTYVSDPIAGDVPLKMQLSPFQVAIAQGNVSFIRTVADRQKHPSDASHVLHALKEMELGDGQKGVLLRVSNALFLHLCLFPSDFDITISLTSRFFQHVDTLYNIVFAHTMPPPVLFLEQLQWEPWFLWHRLPAKEVVYLSLPGEEEAPCMHVRRPGRYFRRQNASLEIGESPTFVVFENMTLERGGMNRARDLLRDLDLSPAGVFFHNVLFEQPFLNVLSFIQCLNMHSLRLVDFRPFVERIHEDEIELVHDFKTQYGSGRVTVWLSEEDVQARPFPLSAAAVNCP